VVNGSGPCAEKVLQHQGRNIGRPALSEKRQSVANSFYSVPAFGMRKVGRFAAVDVRHPHYESVAAVFFTSVTASVRAASQDLFGGYWR